jgi:arylformamidase
MEIHDISQTLCEGIAGWPGDPEFRQCWISRIWSGESSNASALEMATHTGTHVDAPLHLDDSGLDIAGVPVHHFLGSARVFAISARTRIREADLSILDWQGVERALFKTRTGRSPGSTFDQNFVYFREDAAEFLTKQRILLVGTDAPSVDAFDSLTLPSHKILLGHGIAILEGTRMEGVPPGDYGLACLPLKLAGLDGSPVRAILWKTKSAVGSAWPRVENC